MNLRVIKKDVKFLVDEYVSDALIGMCYAKDDQKREKLAASLNTALDIHDETIAKINRPDGNKKAYYNTLMKDFVSKLDALYEDMSK